MSNEDIKSLYERLRHIKLEDAKDEEGNLLNNILPSYHMFQSTVSKNLTPSQENFRVDPPMYEMTPIASIGSSLSLLNSAIPSGLQSPMLEMSEGFPFPTPQSNTFNEESANLWENTVLANVHKLENLTNTNNEIAKDLKIDIKVTEKVCQKGVAPTFYDPLKVEFKQGDYIHGYITILNKSPKPISFDMVYVVFEGVTTILKNESGLVDTQIPSTTDKFLTMLDLFASWSYANIDRLVTDNGDPHDWCEGETDPYDNTVLSIDVKRFFQPNVTYKRFFTFRVPEKLLDVACNEHNLPLHTNLPPSLGTATHLDPPSVILAKRESHVKDFASIDTSISYSVEARIIGKATDYYCATNGGDKYVVAKEAICPIRVIPRSNPEYMYDWNTLQKEMNLHYKAFRSSIKEKNELARSLGNIPSNQRNEMAGLTPTVSRNTAEKIRQLYSDADTIKLKFSKNRKQYNDDRYQCMIPFKKKNITGSSKVLGILSLSTPRQSYSVQYVPPKKFDNGKKVDLQLSIPMELTYFNQDKKRIKNMPEVKSSTAELVVLTIRSKKHPIPIEFTHDMCFEDNIVDDKKYEHNNFDSIIIKEFKNDLSELSSHLKTLGNDLLRVDMNMFKNLKSLASLGTKYINLPVEDIQFYTQSSNTSGLHNSVQSIPWDKEEIPNSEYALFSKNFNVLLDLHNCHLKSNKIHENGFNTFNLIPSFQNCLVARLYYLKVSFRFVNGEHLLVHIPVNIENLV